jgi:acetyl esterase/lipase
VTAFSIFLYIQPALSQLVLPLWHDKPPYSIASDTVKEIIEKDGVILIKNVVHPSLTAYFPKKPNGTAVLIFPGGGYGVLAWDHEGSSVAKWLNGFGITAVVVKYRLPDSQFMKDKHWVPLTDALQAIKKVRENALKWKLDTTKIGIMGFSAGGHLVATVSNHYDDFDKGIWKKIAKPDFTILMYPVIFSDARGHEGSSTNLLGTGPPSELMEYFNNPTQVDENTPPAILMHTSGDKTVPVENSIAYYLALKNKNISSELHIYKDGEHGFGMLPGKAGMSYNNWKNDLLNWLISMQLVVPVVKRME